LYYDETSSSGLRWKTDRRCEKYSARLMILKGTPAGTSSGGRWKVYVVHGLFNASRIILQLHGDTFEKGDIVDHINGNPLDNRFSNLRKVTLKVNNQNMSMRSNNTSNVSGVKWATKVRKAGHSDYYATAVWYDMDGIQRCKCFSCKTYGILPSFNLACEYREKMIAYLNEQGAQYTQRHGIKKTTS
jgi:hypothetical protein